MRLLRIRRDDAVKAYKAKRQQIRRALQLGAGVEPGLRSAKLLRRETMVLE